MLREVISRSRALVSFSRYLASASVSRPCSSTVSPRTSTDSTPSSRASASWSGSSSVARTVRPGGERLDLRPRAVRDDAALAHQHDAVGVLVGLLEVVGGEQHGAALLGVRADRGPERAAALDVHAGGRLVEQQQRRVGQQRHREAEPLLLAARALADPAVREAR